LSPFDERLTEELKTAMRARDQLRVDTLRAIKSALKYKFSDKKQIPLTEEECFATFQTLIKQRKEAIEQYQTNGKPEQAEKEQKELEIISEFLPKALTEDELSSMVEAAIKKLGAQSMKDMGAVMKELSPQTVGRADGKVLSDLVKRKLS
jgi:uncharacterized protein YqeY